MSKTHPMDTCDIPSDNLNWRILETLSQAFSYVRITLIRPESAEVDSLTQWKQEKNQKKNTFH